MVGTCTLSSLYVVIWFLSQSAAGHDCIQTVASLRLSRRIIRSSSGQKWRKWTLPAGCAKRWASTSPALPLAALNEEAPTALAYTENTQHLTHTQAITHIGTFLHLRLGLKKKKKRTKKEEILPWNLSPVSFICSPAAVTRDPRSAVCAAVRPQLRHASVKSSSRFHEADVERKHWRAASVCLNFHRLINFFCIVKYTVLIFYMPTVNGLWECILINSPVE